MSRTTRSPQATAALPRLAVQAVRLALSRYAVDSAHAHCVAAHAATLFAHVLTHPATSTAFGAAAPQLRERLLLAALLHDIGQAVAERRHHRHSQYLIEHADAFETWPRQLRADVGALALAHRKPARARWLNERFHGRRELFQLAAMVRVADGLDRAHRSQAVPVWQVDPSGVLVGVIAGITEKDLQHLRERKADAWALAFPYPLRLMSSDAR
ncbi:MAG: HD domain-containing protein [Firmicutes bacterium]|nr:HD domain-containing protein [Bacillota bacterium]